MLGGSAIALCSAAPALGASVAVSLPDPFLDPPASLSYEADRGEKNSVSISLQLGGKIAIVSDAGARRMRTGNGCVPLSNTKALCDATVSSILGSLPAIPPAKPGIGEIRARLYDGNDSFVHKAGPVRFITVGGGPGDDRLTTFGSNDDLLGHADDDRLRAGKGNDSLTGGTGADDLSGGAGEDFGDYSPFHDPDLPRAVSLDDVANDGAAGEGDNFHSDVEGVFMGTFSSPTVLIGSDADNTLYGAWGDDVIRGMGGSDVVYGGVEGNDELDGGPGADSFDGFRGDDVLLARDGETDLEFDCSVGFDRLVADVIDPSDPSCELDERG